MRMSNTRMDLSRDEQRICFESGCEKQISVILLLHTEENSLTFFSEFRALRITIERSLLPTATRSFFLLKQRVSMGDSSSWVV